LNGRVGEGERGGEEREAYACVGEPFCGSGGRASRLGVCWRRLWVHLFWRGCQRCDWVCRTALHVASGEDEALHTFRPPCRFLRVLLYLRIGVLGICIPARPADDLVSDIGIHHFEPAARRVVLVPRQLPVAQFFEPVEAFVGAEELVDAVEGVGVGFVFALDQLVPFGVLEDFAELERHGCGGGWDGRGCGMLRELYVVLQSDARAECVGIGEGERRC